MGERRGQRLRSENLKTESSALSGADVGLGKLIRLPYIRKPSKHNSHLDQASLESKDSRPMRTSNKQLHLSGMPCQGYEDLTVRNLTQVQIGLCNDLGSETGLPRIGLHPLLPREESLDSFRQKQSLTRVGFSDRLRDLKLGAVLGRGTYSVVRVGRNRQGRKVAVKTYLCSALNTQDRRRNLANQVAVLSQLQHPHLLAFEQCIQSSNSVNLVTELLEGPSLADYLRTHNQQIPQEVARGIARQLARAIGYLHDRSIVHRDLKLQNILLNEQCSLKLIDFGFSLELPYNNHLLHDYCGTLNYIAPEVSARQGYFGKPADIWAFGVVVYRMVAGAFPFKGGLRKGQKPELRLPNEVSPALASLLCQTLNEDYWKRPTAGEILASQWLSR